MLIGDAGTSIPNRQGDPSTNIRNGNVTYTAPHAGVTLPELSARYGVTVPQILAANPQLRGTGALQAGQEVTIPVMDNGDQLPTQVSDTPGASLTSIASAMHVSVPALAAANGLSDTSELNYPMQLWVPVKTSAQVGVSPASNPFGTQVSAVDAAVKQYNAAQTPAQHTAASAAITAAVEQELGARAAVEVPPGQSASDTLLSDYGQDIATRYGSDPAVAQAVQQGVTNEQAVVATNTAVSSGDSAQVYAAVVNEIQARGDWQPLTAAQIKQYVAQIGQRYASDPAANKLVQAALQKAPADILAQQIVTQASAAGDTSAQLAALNKAYQGATAPVQKALLSQPGAIAILQAAAAQDMKPLSGVQNSPLYAQVPMLQQSLQNLDGSAKGLDPTVAAALVNQALPALNQFNSQYAKEYGGLGIGSDTLHAGPVTVPTIMDLSGLIAGTPQGDADIKQFAQIGFWDNNTVSNALHDGASTAYPMAIAQYAKAHGQDPTNVISMISQAVQQDHQRVNADIKALATNNAQLTWLINNVGPSMSTAQLQAAVKSYESQEDWATKNKQLIQQTIADAKTLTANMSDLSALAQSDPSLAKTLDVNGTLSGIMNDPETSYGLSLAVGSDPTGFAGSPNEPAFLNLVSSLKLADQGRKTAQLLGSLYVRGLVTNALKNNVDWDGEAPLSQVQTVIDTLKSPGLSNWMGVNDDTVWKSAVSTVEKNLTAEDGGDMQTRLKSINTSLNKLKALSASTPAGQMLRSIAVAYAFANTVNSAQKIGSADNPADLTFASLDTLAAAAGLLQKGANLANGFGLVSKDSLVGSFAKDSANGAISAFAGALDVVEGVGDLGGWLGQKQNTANGVFSITGGTGSLLYAASQFSDAGFMSSIAGTLGVEGGAGALSATLGLVGVGIVAATVVGQGIYQAIKGDHANEAATASFLQAGGYSKAAASALSQQDGVLSGAGGASGMPFLAKYAALEHLSTAQLQNWVNSLTPGQLHTLDQCLLQTAGDCHGNVANFTDGPQQQGVIPDYSGGGAAIITLANTVAAFQGNLTSSGVPLPPKS